jgi:hypothetical protein
MKQINDGGPAFPGQWYDYQPTTGVQVVREQWPGLSLRDWFAGKALEGLLPKLPLVDQTGKLGIKVEDKIQHNADIAESCYCIADAMLAERERKTNDN